jgi:hypothetical protein
MILDRRDQHLRALCMLVQSEQRLTGTSRPTTKSEIGIALIIVVVTVPPGARRLPAQSAGHCPASPDSLASASRRNAIFMTLLPNGLPLGRFGAVGSTLVVLVTAGASGA